jgi:hypothetical protein
MNIIIILELLNFSKNKIHFQSAFGYEMFRVLKKMNARYTAFRKKQLSVLNLGLNKAAKVILNESGLK